MHPIRHLRALLRTWRGRFIGIFVVGQLLLPLHYYVARDPHDERFAWRMFSPMRMAQCTPHFALDGKPLHLDTEFHQAWIEIAQRGRFVVVEAMAHHLCAQHPSSAVTVSLDCTYLQPPDPTAVPIETTQGTRWSLHWGGFDMCQVPLL